MLCTVSKRLPKIIEADGRPSQAKNKSFSARLGGITIWLAGPANSLILGIIASVFAGRGFLFGDAVFLIEPPAQVHPTAAL